MQSFYEGVKAEAESFGTVFESEDAKEGFKHLLKNVNLTFKGK